jgi:hypothetical protein
MNFILALIAITYISICGFGLVKFILKDNIPFSIFGLVPLCFGAGLGALAILGNIIMISGYKISFITAYVPLFVLFAYALKNCKTAQKVYSGDLLGAIKKISWMEWLFIFIILFGIISVFIMSIAFPLHFWDSRAIWGTKAKMLFYSGTIFSSDFMDINRINAHFRYPLLFPISQATIYFVLGQADDWAVMLLIGLFFPLMIFFLYDLARIYLQDREKALMAAALLAVLPIFFRSEGPAYSGFADTPLAMLFCLSFGAALLWKKSKDFRMLLLCSFLSGILLLTKNEGINLVALNLFLLALPDKIIMNKRSILDLIKIIAIYTAIVAIIAAPWFYLSHAIPFESDINDIFQIKLSNIGSYIPRIMPVIMYSFKAFLGVQKNMLNQGFLWGGLWGLFIVTSLASILMRFSSGIHLFLVVLLNFLLISAGYVLMQITPENFMISNIFRIYLSISPVISLQIVSTLKELESDKAAK